MNIALAAILVAASTVGPASVEPAGDEAVMACPSAPSVHRAAAACPERRFVCFVDESRDRIVCRTPLHASPAKGPRAEGFPRAPRVPLWRH